MREYKIKCNNPMIKSHAIEMLIELGYKDASTKDEYLTIVTFEDGDIYSTVPEDDQYEGREILSMDQLKGLVVLKRNDVADANYTYCGKPVLKLETQDYRVWNNLDKCWAMNLGSDTDLRNGLKPVAKAETVMKEYLDKDYVLREVKQTGGDNRVPSDWIEVPEGAEKYIQGIKYPERFGFVKGDKFWDDEWIDHGDSRDEYSIVWQRHTQPEELPFVDDDKGLDKIKILVGGSLESAINRAKSLGYWNCQFEKIPSDAHWLLCNENGTVDFSKVENIEGEYEEFTMASDDTLPHSHYFIDVSDTDSIDFYEIAHRYGISDPCVQHILKKCLAIGNRGHKDLHTDMKDIHDTAVRMLAMHGIV